MSGKLACGLLAAAGLFFTGLSACSTNSDTVGLDESGNSKKAKIALMTSLPIVWGDGASMSDIVSGESKSAPIYKYWQKHYDVSPVDSLAELGKSKTDIVMLVQPKAMDPADLSDLDSWIRAGGRALILTDPELMWHSDLPLGDSERPLASGLLSPLLDHWGLRLNSPDERGQGVVEIAFSDYEITTAGVGSFALVSDNKVDAAKCLLSDAGLIAQCRLEKGQVILVADADFINEAFWADEPGWKRDGEDDGIANAMRLTDDLIAEFELISSVSNN